ncbi:hypothetical protein HZ326_25914 [Fusarium oxysporum f. sp. albedinis]|nr:hypothetical protein HZ326_25914 [Fusarium oxysporum f. sp. albedinis]
MSPHTLDNQRVLSKNIVEVWLCLDHIPHHLVLSPSSTLHRACPICLCERWTNSYYVTYGMCDKIFSKLEVWHLKMDTMLPQRPSSQQIKETSLPMLLFEQWIDDSACRLKHE